MLWNTLAAKHRRRQLYRASCIQNVSYIQYIGIETNLLITNTTCAEYQCSCSIRSYFWVYEYSELEEWSRIYSYKRVCSCVLVCSISMYECTQDSSVKFGYVRVVLFNIRTVIYSLGAPECFDWHTGTFCSLVAVLLPRCRAAALRCRSLEQVYSYLVLVHHSSIRVWVPHIAQLRLQTTRTIHTRL